MQRTGHPFWNWSLEFYDRPGIEDALIELQDRLGLDVNLLLFGCWTAVTGRGRISSKQWQSLVEGSAAWRDNIVEPLRRIRRYLKSQASEPGVSDLRERIMAVELLAERLAQLQIAGLAEVEAAVSPERRRLSDVKSNLSDYVISVRGTMQDEDQELLDFLAEACCSDV